jgi:hypothetical protein
MVLNVRRLSQHEDESGIDYIRRLAGVSNYEIESLWDSLPSVDATMDFFDLWYIYDTEFWEGIYCSIEEGADPAPAKAFLEKWHLKWRLPPNVT